MKRTGISLVAYFLTLAIAPPMTAQTQELPPPLCHPFEFFFEDNSAELTAEGLQIVSLAVAEAKRFGADDIIIDGTAYVPGPEENNPSIALQRAEAAKTEMVRQGISEETIVTSGEESAVPPFEANPDFNKRYNRRVVIDVYCH